MMPRTGQSGEIEVCLAQLQEADAFIMESPLNKRQSHQTFGLKCKIDEE
jgi:hypothetical protein